MDVRLRKQELLERAQHQEEKARRQTNAQAQDIMRALALLYREMANELEDSGLFERRFLAGDFADLAGGEMEWLDYPVITMGKKLGSRAV
jgi:hypothetical protein